MIACTHGYNKSAARPAMTEKDSNDRMLKQYSLAAMPEMEAPITMSKRLSACCSAAALTFDCPLLQAQQLEAVARKNM